MRDRKAKVIEDVAATSSSSTTSTQESGYQKQQTSSENGNNSKKRKTSAHKLQEETDHALATNTLSEEPDVELPAKKSRLSNSNVAEELKIISWNVGGIRALAKKNGIKYLMDSDADIICLQEVRCPNKDLPTEVKHAARYHKYWVDSKSKAGYAGCATWSKQKPINTMMGIEDDEQDKEGRAVTLEFEKFYIINTYVPNAGRKLVTLPKRLAWNAAFETFCKKLDAAKPIIVAGDMNVAHNEIDLAKPQSNTKNAGFTKEERDGMTTFLELGFVDTFRRLYPDATGKYTFWTYMANARARNVGWRLDYFIVSARLAINVMDNVICDEVMGSDHCPIMLTCKL